MRISPCKQTFKNDLECVLRSPEPRDAAQRIAFLHKINGETPYMARSASDSPRDILLVEQMIEDQLEADDTLEIAAMRGGQMIGCGGISPVSRAHPRRRHRAQLGIAILRECWSLGIGSEILRRLIVAAANMGYEQIELSVVASNERALHLYRRFSFEIAGRIPHALKYEDGSYGDEILMNLPL